MKTLCPSVGLCIHQVRDHHLNKLSYWIHVRNVCSSNVDDSLIINVQSSQDHNVPQAHILLVSILTAQLGVHSVAYAYPEVKIITSAMDTMVNDSYHIPGVGNYGDRYFGTEPEEHTAVNTWTVLHIYIGIT